MKIGLLGGGGFAKEVAEIAELNGFEVVGYFADDQGTASWKYLGKLTDAKRSKAQMTFAFCIGAVNSDTTSKRREIIASLKKDGLIFETLVSPNAVVSKGVKLGVGVVVAHGVVLSVDCQVGDFCILNTNAVVGHDAVVGSNSILAPLCFIGGHAQIGSDVLIGPNASILEERIVAERTVIGCGAVVHRNIKSDMTVLPVVTKTV